MKRSKDNHDNSESDQSDSELEQKIKKKQKKHSKHVGHLKNKLVKEEPVSLSSDSDGERKVVKKKKSKHRSSGSPEEERKSHKKIHVKVEPVSLSSESEVEVKKTKPKHKSSSSSENEEEKKCHHKKKKKKSKHKAKQEEVDNEIKIDPDEEKEKPRHHHRHRHHRRNEERNEQGERHGHSSRPSHLDREHSRNNHSDEQRDNDRRHDRRPNDSRDTGSRGSRWSNDRHQQGTSTQHRDKKPFCDEAEEYEWGRKGGNSEDKNTEQQQKQKPDFGLSGKLTEDTNMYNGVVIKYSEPPDARKPKRRWRLYPFKGDTQLPVLHIHRQSAFLMGRDRKVADIPVDHPSCSKQHAALQYRLTGYTRENGTKGKRIRLYIIDLESANGTFVNNKKIEPKRYVELLEKDVIKFGFSLREYVLLHEHSKDSDHDDDDVQDDE